MVEVAGAVELKNRHHEKAQPTSLLNLHTSFQFLSSIWRETAERHIYGHYQVYISNFNFVDWFGGEIGAEQPFYKIKGREKSLYLRSYLPQEVDFWIFYATLVNPQLIRSKRDNACVFGSSASPPLNWAYLNFDPRLSPLIRLVHGIVPREGF